MRSVCAVYVCVPACVYACVCLCACATLPGDWELNHVGPPLPCNEIKLIDVPEMEYYAKDGKGEVGYHLLSCS